MSAIDVALWDIVGKKLAAKKIAGTAEAYYVNIAPHNPNGPICPAASLHLATSIANFLILGQGATNTSAYREIFADGRRACRRCGCRRFPASASTSRPLT